MELDFQEWALAAIVAITLVALIGFFFTKGSGFGGYSTSTLLLLLVVGLSGILLTAGHLPGPVFANIFFAVIGFAGGLFAGREAASRKRGGPEPPASGGEARDGLGLQA